MNKRYINTFNNFINENIDTNQFWVNKNTPFYDDNKFKNKNGDIIQIDFYEHKDIIHINAYWLYNGKKIPIGKNEMKRDDNSYLRSSSYLYVNKSFRRTGIATAMYDYLNNKGFKIRPTNEDDKLFNDGINFWKSN